MSDPLPLFQLELMRQRDEDVPMLQQIEQKNGPELIAFVNDWWTTRSRQILLDLAETGEIDERACRRISEYIKAQEQTSWRDLPAQWRRQFGVPHEL